jgi:hypothetical protein
VADPLMLQMELKDKQTVLAMRAQQQQPNFASLIEKRLQEKQKQIDQRRMKAEELRVRHVFASRNYTVL